MIALFLWPCQSVTSVISGGRRGIESQVITYYQNFLLFTVLKNTSTGPEGTHFRDMFLLQCEAFLGLGCLFCYVSCSNLSA